MLYSCKMQAPITYTYIHAYKTHRYRICTVYTFISKFMWKMIYSGRTTYQCHRTVTFHCLFVSVCDSRGFLPFQFSAGVPAMIANYFVFYKLSYYCGRLCNKWCRMDRKHWRRTIVYLMCVDQVAFDTETSNDFMWKVTDSYKNPACGTRKLGKMKLNGRNEWNNQNNRRKNWFVKRTTEKNKKNCQNWEEH